MPTTPPPAVPVIAQPKQMFQKIIEASCTYYKLTEDELKLRENAEERKIIYYLLREEAFCKYSRIAKYFEKKDTKWIGDVVEEVSAQKNIYPHISLHIKNIMQIVSTL